MTDIQRLLADYVNNGSEAAFQELAERYLNLVYSTAVRLVGGDTHLAEDVAQTVFVDLAHLAKNLSHEVRLGGWLHRHTCFVAAKTLRGERRRQARERQAIEMNAPPDHLETHLGQVAPILDEAINRLGAADRTAVLLRFYEQLDFRLVGEALGTSEAAAQKRVTRALEKLHLLLKHRGVTFSAAALGTALAGEAVTAAPAGLAASIPAAALASLTTGTGTTLSLLKFMATTKLQAGIINAVIVVSVVTPLLVQHHAQARLREQDKAWQLQTNQLAQVNADNQRLANLLAQAKNTQSLSDNQLPEVLRLRSEVGLLRRSVQEMTSAKTALPLSPEDQLASMKKMYAAQADRLKQWLEANPSEKIPELQNLSDQAWVNAADTLTTDDDFARAARILRANAEDRVFEMLGVALRKYARDNNGQFPNDLSELKPYFESPIDDVILQRYEILPASSLVSELQPGGDWVITQKAPVNPALDLREAMDLNGGRNADERVTNRWTLVH
ncbi:MAG: sigma-70 family RNA polymerase sigma factor [Verrucomicrobiota bacterium]|jgi:RNA polymerase sigma factor (sigma-70 family)